MDLTSLLFVDSHVELNGQKRYLVVTRQQVRHAASTKTEEKCWIPPTWQHHSFIYFGEKLFALVKKKMQTTSTGNEDVNQSIKIIKQYIRKTFCSNKKSFGRITITEVGFILLILKNKQDSHHFYIQV